MNKSWRKSVKQFIFLTLFAISKSPLPRDARDRERFLKP